MNPRRMFTYVLLSLVPAATAGVECAGASAAPPRVPQGFVGTVIDWPTFPAATGVDLTQQLDAMVATGVESVRVEFNWAATQPYPTWSEVPADQLGSFTDVDGLPLQLGALDNMVQLAASRGLEVQADVLDAPRWDTLNPDARFVHTPRLYAPYGSFVHALVDRYGPKGSLWIGQGVRRPIHSWELWNEPNLADWWADQPDFAPSYVQLLRVGHDAVKRADRGATVVLAGLTDASWLALAQIYAVPGARALFDVVAVHPYTRSPQGVLSILDRDRATMDGAGDKRKTMLADEVGWPSSLGRNPQRFGFETNEAGQAKNIATVLPLLAGARRRLKLLGFDLYDWAGTEDPNGLEFSYAGLLRLQGDNLVAKPALQAFRQAALALEGCRQKGPVAPVCRRPS